MPGRKSLLYLSPLAGCKWKADECLGLTRVIPNGPICKTVSEFGPPDRTRNFLITSHVGITVISLTAMAFVDSPACS
ncbi:hypothetical protein LY78DRAFT_434984 [Colletotrichum sublineola]|nr:hypothetical protein LY78DRAFT_434984 [Colletotrichum sublineola]